MQINESNIIKENIQIVYYRKYSQNYVVKFIHAIRSRNLMLRKKKFHSSVGTCYELHEIRSPLVHCKFSMQALLCGMQRLYLLSQGEKRERKVIHAKNASLTEWANSVRLEMTHISSIHVVTKYI